MSVEEPRSKSARRPWIPAIAASMVALFVSMAPAAAAETPQSQAQERPVYSLVVTASKLDPESEVTILDVRALQQAGAATVADALRLAPEVIVLQYGPRGAVEKVGLKGASSAQALLLVDGGPSPAQGAPVVLELPLSMIERIELIKGPRSLDGAGAINVVTKAAAAQAAAQVSSASGFAGRDVSVVEGGALGQTNYRIAAALTTQPDASSGLFSSQRYVQLRFDHELSPRSEVNASLTSGIREHGALGTAAVGAGAGRTDAAATVDVTYAYELSQGFIEAKGFARTARSGAGAFDPSAGESVTLVGGEVRATVETGSREFTVGALTTRESGSSGALATPDLVVENRTLFGEFSQSLGANASAIVGARAHWGAGVSPVLSPSLLVSVNPSPQTTLRAAAAHAYRVPTVSDLRAQAPTDPKLKPEQGWRYELGLSRQIGAGGFDVGIYQARLTDRISWQPDTSGASRPLNLAQTVTQGVELGVRAALGRGLSSFVRWRSIDDRDMTTGLAVPYAPSSEMRAGILYDGVATRANLELQLLGQRLDGSGAPIGAQAFANGRIVHSARRGFDLFVEGYNLLDVQAEPLGHALATTPGRTIMFGASLDF